MTTPVGPRAGVLPLRKIATCARPDEQYAALRAHGVHRRDADWAVARPDDVQAALTASALIGSVLLDDDPGADVGQRIDRALRHDAPVQSTRRHVDSEVILGEVTVPPGAEVWVLLAAAERGPTAPPTTFGAGPHACPGSSVAVALARGVVTAVQRLGLRPVSGQPMVYEPRPNLRLPAHVWMTRP